MSDSDILATFNIIHTTDIVVNTGGPAIITARGIAVSDAKAALDAFNGWAAGKRGSTDPFALDVTSVSGERTVIPFSRIVMLRTAA